MTSPMAWIVPIIYITASDHSPKLVWLKGKEDYVMLSTKDEWVKINYRFGSYYRSHYDEESIIQLSHDLFKNNSILHPMDKLSIVTDMMALLRIGKLNISAVLFHCDHLKKETELYLMSQFFFDLKYIYRLIIDIEEIRTKFENYSIGFSRPIIQRLGYDLHDDHSTRSLQTLAISVSVGFNEKETLDRARTAFKKYIDEKTP
ncbi:Endoplasmic reticulum aminopeptidase 1 [Thelohanellus kitauei]|nr:Endoplasmic reticulum aminopeptidase 1 [Thelohanellus kitauei]